MQSVYNARRAFSYGVLLGKAPEQCVTEHKETQASQNCFPALFLMNKWLTKRQMRNKLTGIRALSYREPSVSVERRLPFKLVLAVEQILARRRILDIYVGFLSILQTKIGLKRPLARMICVFEMFNIYQKVHAIRHWVAMIQHRAPPPKVPKLVIQPVPYTKQPLRFDRMTDLLLPYPDTIHEYIDDLMIVSQEEKPVNVIFSPRVSR
jgi:hypothetical protein